MNVLMCKRADGAWGYITDGMVNTLKSCGYNVKRYDDADTNVWDTFQPDLYIGCSGHRQHIPQSRKCKVAIHVNPYSEFDIQPNINETPETIEWVKRQNPDVVFGYGLKKHAEYWSYWQYDVCPWVPMPTAGDATRFKPHFDRYEKRDLDIIYIGGRWKYKSQQIDKFLVDSLDKLDYSKAIYGYGDWPAKAKFRGGIDEKLVPNLLTQAKVGPCISEPHTLIWGIDLPERVFKLTLSGIVAVHDPVAGMRDYFSSVIACQDPADYHNTIKLMLEKSLEDRLEIAKKQYYEAATKHTYHHRLAGLFSQLGWNDEAVNILNNLKSHVTL